MGALDKAGYLAMLRDPILRFQIGGIAGLLTGIPQALVAGALGLVQGVAAILGIPVTGPLALGAAALADLLTLIADTVGLDNVMRALALYVHRECFDVWGDGAQGEVAFASVLERIPPAQRYALYAQGLAAGVGGNSVIHLPALALSAVDGADPVVGPVYWGVVADWRARPSAKLRT
jgi:hypothetical protein